MNRRTLPTLVALLACAFPAVAAAQTSGYGDTPTTTSTTTQSPTTTAPTTTTPTTTTTKPTTPTTTTPKPTTTAPPASTSDYNTKPPTKTSTTQTSPPPAPATNDDAEQAPDNGSGVEAEQSQSTTPQGAAPVAAPQGAAPVAGTSGVRAAAAPSRLAYTGSEAWLLALIGSFALVAGTALVRTSRRA